jgi:hypothetical protein
MDFKAELHSLALAPEVDTFTPLRRSASDRYLRVP